MPRPWPRLSQKSPPTCPRTVTIDLAHLADAFSFHRQGADAGDVERFKQLHRAVRESIQLELLYWSASRDAVTRRVVDPYHLASVDGSWYLIAYCHLREETLMFAPARVRELSETGIRIERPADFRIADYLDAGFRAVRGHGPPQTIRLRFTADAARYVRGHHWHRSQQLEEQTDGGAILTIQLNHLLEVKRWVLSFGACCEVLEPKELRDGIVKELGVNQLRYSSPADGKGQTKP